MPVFKLTTNKPAADIPDTFCTAVTKLIAEALKKPDMYVCVIVNAGQMMTFGGTDTPCALVELESLGAVGGDRNKDLVQEISTCVHEKLGIDKDRFYVKITDVPRTDLGFKGKTFA